MNKLREYRKARVLKRQELARLAGVSIQTIHRAEAGGRVRMSTLQRLCEALQLSKAEKIALVAATPLRD